MATKQNKRRRRVLALAPSTRGFGFAVLEGKDRLIDWGLKAIPREKNLRSVEEIGKMVSRVQPETVVLEDPRSAGVRRSGRIIALCDELGRRCTEWGVELVMVDRVKVRRHFFGKGKSSKFALAEALVQRFPEELGLWAPRKRKPWMSEDYRMDAFDAIAVGTVV